MQGLHIGDAREFAALLPPQSVQTIVTSPPYWGLRSYLPADDPAKPLEMGSEPTPEAFVANLVALFAALRPALRDDGTLWLNLGDSYATNGTSGPQGATGERASRSFTAANLPAKVPQGCKPKDLCGIPWLVAFALRADGWYLRSDIVWHKPNPMPESVRDRPTRAHEYLFLLTKQARYFYDADAIAEPISQASIDRISQPNFANQTGGEKDYGTTGVNASRSMRKTLENFASKQDGHGRRHAGFNDRYDFDNPAPTRNRRDVWTLPTIPYPGSHYATMPPELVRPCILAGSRPGDLVCDPFLGSGTVAAVAIEEGRRWVGCDLDARNAALVSGRIDKRQIRMGAA